tara:strand:- start:10 stop:291 length:282 start_codon:yes stop_codon:yes gene_type:complete
MGALLVLPHLGFAKQIEESPTGLEMMTDLVVARPLGVVMTAVGTAAFIVTLPFSAAGDNMKESAEALVVAPARETFVRCLECVRPGRKERIKE